jgi:hypothetical protein
MGLIDNAIGLAKENVGITALGAGLVGVGAGVGIAALVGGKTKKKARKSRTKRGRITHTKRGWKQDRKRRSKQKWEVAYQKHKRKHHSKKSKSRRGIHYTKKGQPYKILANGRARFIKKTKRRAR